MDGEKQILQTVYVNVGNSKQTHKRRLLFIVDIHIQRNNQGELAINRYVVTESQNFLYENKLLANSNL